MMKSVLISLVSLAFASSLGAQIVFKNFHLSATLGFARPISGLASYSVESQNYRIILNKEGHGFLGGLGLEYIGKSSKAGFFFDMKYIQEESAYENHVRPLMHCHGCGYNTNIPFYRFVTGYDRGSYREESTYLERTMGLVWRLNPKSKLKIGGTYSFIQSRKISSKYLRTTEYIYIPSNQSMFLLPAPAKSVHTASDEYVVEFARSFMLHFSYTKNIWKRTKVGLATDIGVSRNRLVLFANHEIF